MARESQGYPFWWKRHDDDDKWRVLDIGDWAYTIGDSVPDCANFLPCHDIYVYSHKYFSVYVWVCMCVSMCMCVSVCVYHDLWVKKHLCTKYYLSIKKFWRREEEKETSIKYIQLFFRFFLKLYLLTPGVAKADEGGRENFFFVIRGN